MFFTFFLLSTAVPEYHGLFAAFQYTWYPSSSIAFLSFSETCSQFALTSWSQMISGFSSRKYSKKFFPSIARMPLTFQETAFIYLEN